METGQIVLADKAAALLENEQVKKAYLDKKFFFKIHGRGEKEVHDEEDYHSRRNTGVSPGTDLCSGQCVPRYFFYGK
jgi:hypothetical protein